MNTVLIRFNRYELIYLSFALDSMLKFQLGGLRVHLGVLAVIILTTLDLVFQYRRASFIKFIKLHWSISPFLFYFIINVIVNSKFPGASITLVYYALGILVFFFFSLNVSKIRINAIVLFQWLLIFTGLLQHALLQLVGYQLAFFNPEHYEYAGSFAVRLRGFFMEPNWYAIILSFNFLFLLLRIGKGLRDYKLLILGTLICTLLNGSYTFLGTVIICIFLRFFYDLPRVNIKRAMYVAVFVLFGFLMILGRISARKSVSSVDSTGISINHSSRLLPAVRTLGYIFSQNSYVQLFGVGVGSWPYVALEQNRLGYIGTQGEYIIKPGQRDSAEFQVYLFELGYLGVLLFLFDFFYLYWRYRRSNFILSISAAFMIACFFVYPIFRFSMYLVPFYLIRSHVVTMQNKCNL